MTGKLTSFSRKLLRRCLTYVLLYIKSFGIRFSPLLESANIKPQNVEKHFTPNIPAWCVKQPNILFDFHCGKNPNQIHTY